MKIKIIIWTMAVTSLWLLTSMATAQERPEMTKAEHERMDSLANTYKKDQIKAQKTMDEKIISDLNTKKRESKAKAKEAQRVEQNANDAARESRSAYRTEKKAQKARKLADAQAKKAAKSREIERK